MRYAHIKLGKVVNVVEADSDDALGVDEILVLSQRASIGDSYDGTLFSSPSIPISRLRDEATGRIKRDVKNTIKAGVVSNALGTDHTYPTSPEDLGNLTAVVLSASINGTAGEPYKFWCEDAAGVLARRSHTVAQITTVGNAVFAHVASTQDRYEAKIEQIRLTNSRAGLEQITL